MVPSDNPISTFIYFADIFGVIVFALSGALLAGRYCLDPFGVMVLAAVTAVGGGTIRDIILGAPVFWPVQTEYVVAIFFTSLLTILLIREPKLVPKRFMHNERPNHRCNRQIFSLTVQRFLP
ncbi:trimeric intracellular cation channel family protein [Thalassotalea sp. ND16A]|uniref:trimeric intracellular cation channel family protein n=1 Tax=Thalassotalea sp. ND16A TaxID=1535422 RepID=UPI00051D54EC|nr:TRIC cation channel family protein [Thalassotalea sp. ND16A]KGJ99321.1 hypothetical protein ND16A_3842 [Thalassotalea sp. ND16A]